MTPQTAAPLPAPAPPWFPWLKGSIFALLAANAAGYALFGRPTEALDSLAWFTLLALFELETAYPQRMQQKRVAALVRAGRLVAGIAVVMAAIGFVREHEWLDAVNAMLWIAVVILLELQVRSLDTVERHRPLFAGIAASLCAAMAALVVIWAWGGEWFDAYDALLWLIAFVALELNVLGVHGEPAAAQGAVLNTLLVAVAVTAGLIALVGVPLRAWQFQTGRFRPDVPRHALARVTFSVFAVLFLVPNLAAWAYAVYTAHADFTCLESCEAARMRTAITIGMLGCAYALLEGFLFTARRRARS